MFENVKLVLEERLSREGKPYQAVKAVFEDESSMDIGYNDLAGRLATKLITSGKYVQKNKA